MNLFSLSLFGRSAAPRTRCAARWRTPCCASRRAPPTGTPTSGRTSCTGCWPPPPRAVSSRANGGIAEGTSEDVSVRMKNLLSWFGHVERMSDERMAKKGYEVTTNDKRGSSFDHCVCTKRLMAMDEAKVVCRDSSARHSDLYGYPARDPAWS